MAWSLECTNISSKMHIFHNQETIWLPPTHGGILQTHQGMKISSSYARLARSNILFSESFETWSSAIFWGGTSSKKNPFEYEYYHLKTKYFHCPKLRSFWIKFGFLAHYVPVLAVASPLGWTSYSKKLFLLFTRV